MPLPPKTVNSIDELKALQSWFSDVITRDLYNNEINPYGTLMASIKDETKRYITSTPKLKSFERMEIYNQQYWYRLLTIMQDEFPILRHLIGIEAFNSLVENYLREYPSASHFLSELQDHFIPFIEKHYDIENDKTLLDAVKFDFAYSKAFEAKEILPLDPQKLSPAQQQTLSELKLTLQNHIYLFEFDYDFNTYRDLVVDDPEEIIFPELIKNHHFRIIFRQNNVVYSTEITELQYALLNEFKRGSSIENAIALLEERFSEDQFKLLQEWFSEWISKGFFQSIPK